MPSLRRLALGKRIGTYVLIGLLSFLYSLPNARADISQLSEAEFRELARDMAQKVNLFREVWAKDPEAEFYGGTTRDFLYWLRGEFRGAGTREQALKVAAELRARPIVNVREFIVGQSDIDIITQKTGLVRARAYGVRAVDHKPPTIFDPTHADYRAERMQGHIPAEKIRLAKSGFVASTDMGDGLREIYNGKLSLALADPKLFAQTDRALAYLNHPVLLVLRFQRLLAMEYFHRYGKETPDPKLLLEGIDPETDKAIRAVMRQVSDGVTLKPYFAKHDFGRWFNGTLEKGFRSYTNPDAMMALVRHYGIDKLSALYPEIEPINKYLFRMIRDSAQIGRALRQFKVDREKFFEDYAKVFPDGHVYHGTRENLAFRSIVFEGILPSENGSAGAGLYGVPAGDMKFAEDWGGEKERIVKIAVDPNAKIVDIRKGHGKKIWDEFEAKHGKDYEKFQKMFGVDVIIYPYGKTFAVVVKNSAVLGKANGVHRMLLPLPELLEKVRPVKSTLEIIELAALNNLNGEEEDLLIQRSSTSKAAIAADLSDAKKLRQLLLKMNHYSHYRLHEGYREVPGLDQALLQLARDPDEKVAIAAFSILVPRNPSGPLAQQFHDILVERVQRDVSSFRIVFGLLDRYNITDEALNKRVAEGAEVRFQRPADVLEFLKGCPADQNMWECLQSFFKRFNNHAGVMRTVLAATHDPAFPERGRTWLRELALDRVVALTPLGERRSDAFFSFLLDQLIPGDEGSSHHKALILHLEGRSNTPEFDTAGFTKYNSRLVAMLRDPAHANTGVHQEGDFAGYAWDLLRPANTLTPAEVDSLAKLYGPKLKGSALEVLERQLRKTRSHPEIYGAIIRRALEGFPISTGHGLNGWDYYGMMKWSRILSEADFAFAGITRDDIVKFSIAKTGIDSRIDGVRAPILKRLEAYDAAELARAPLGTARVSIEEYVKRADVAEQMRLYRSEGADTWDVAKKLGTLLDPLTYPEDLSAFRELLAGVPKKDYVVENILEYMFRQGTAQRLFDSPVGATALAETKAYLRRNPFALNKAAAAYMPDFGRELLTEKFDELLAKGGRSFDGYVEIFKANPALIERLNAAYKKDPLTPLSDRLKELVPGFKLTKPQVEKAIGKSGSVPYGLAEMFRDPDNLKLLVAYAEKKKSARLAGSVARDYLKAFPEIVMTEKIFPLWIVDSPHADLYAENFRKLSREKLDAFAATLIRQSPRELYKFAFLLPLSDTNRQALERKVARLKPDELTDREFRALLDAGANPKIPEKYFTKDFITRGVYYRGEDPFVYYFGKHAGYRAKVIALAFEQGFDWQEKARLYILAPQEARALIDSAVIHAMAQTRSWPQHLGDLAYRLADDEELSRQIFAYYQARPNLERHPLLEQRIPDFSAKKFRDELNSKARTMEAVGEMASDPLRSFTVDSRVQKRFLPAMLADPALSGEAKSLAALLAFRNGVALEEAAPLLKALVRDPKFIQGNRFGPASFLAENGASREAVNLSLDLLTDAKAAGQSTKDWLYQIFVTRSLFGGGSVHHQLTENYLGELEARVRAGKIRLGTPAAELAAEIFATAKTYSKDFKGPTIASYTLLEEFLGGRFVASLATDASKMPNNGCRAFAKIGKTTKEKPRPPTH